MHQVRYAPTEYRAPGKPEEDRELEFIISTSARDSHRTVLNQRNWDLERYKRAGIVGYQHNVWGAGMCNEPNPDFVIGPGRAWSEGDTRATGGAQLIGHWKAEPREINELAEKVFRKVLFGTLKATSVGFKPIGEGRFGEGDEAEGRVNETYYFEGQELYEWSVVNMGSNPETVKRSLEADTRAAISFIKSRVPDLSTRDILGMTVRDVLEALDGKPERAAFTSITQREVRQKAVELIRGTFTL